MVKINYYGIGWMLRRKMTLKHFALHVESGWILRNIFSLKER